MSALIEEVFAEKFAKAREEGIEQERASFQKKQRNAVRSLTEVYKLSVEDIASILSITVEEVEAMRAQCNNFRRK